MTVAVTDQDEGGTVELSSDEPQVGTQVTASLTDDDGVVSVTTWSWARSANKTSWTTIANASSSSYTPVDADVNNYVRATATYTDGQGGNKTAQGISESKVVAGPVVNSAPSFPTNTVRKVDEGTPAGQNIGAPVTADDPGDTLTYSLEGPESAFFDIATSTGQLMTKSELDHEDKGHVHVQRNSDRHVPMQPTLFK